MAFWHLFNESWYVQQNPDVRIAVDAGETDARTHFELFGRYEGRAPVPAFDPVFYYQAHADIRQAVDGDMGATIGHFMQYGYLEPRALSPFFDMAAYLAANPDVAAAFETQGLSPMAHLLNFGVAEGRDLGNGVSLTQFANDPVFNNAASAADALQRVAEVAPFLPTFQPPAGWEAPANTPIPLDFVPVEGEKLVVPAGLRVPDGVSLPDTFEPWHEAPAFAAEIVQQADNNVLVFSGTAQGDISMSVSGHDAVFLRDGHELVVSNFDTTVDVVEIKNGVLTGDGAHIEALSLVSDGGELVLPEDPDQNVLVYSDQRQWDAATSKTLLLQIDGDTLFNLGNPPSADVGYYLSDITVKGGQTLIYDEEYEDWYPPVFELESLYFGKGATRLNSAEFGGDTFVTAYVSNEANSNPSWEITFGDGFDELILNEIGSGEGIALPGRLIDGGQGSNALELSLSLYKQWLILEDSGELGDLHAQPIIRNFDYLDVPAEDGMTYRSSLLGNQFENISMSNDEPTVNVTVESGFDYVFASGHFYIDATALRGDEADVFLWAGTDDISTIKLAELDQINGYKSGLSTEPGERHSDIGVVIGGQEDSLEGVTVIVENMTLAVPGGAVTNDSIYLALYLDEAEGAQDLAELITRFDISEGDLRYLNGEERYLNFEIEFDLNGAEEEGGQFNLVLTNVVTAGEYQTMLYSLEPGIDLTLGLISILIDDGSLYYW